MANPVGYKTAHLRPEAREALNSICVVMINRAGKLLTLSDAILEAEKFIKESDKASVNAT
jgi:hypothetical protein